MVKGISSVIATLLMLTITIALVGFSYTWAISDSKAISKLN